MAEKDIAEKTLEALNDVFADIINGLLFKGEKILREDDLVDAQPHSMYKADGKIHEQERDVAKYWVDHRGQKINIRIALFGLENQTKYDKYMPLRSFSYDGSSYKAEIGEPDIYPVVTLVLYFGDTPWGDVKTLYDVVQIPERFKPYVNDYKINLFEIPRLPEEAIDYFHSDFRVVVDYFVKKRSNPDYRPSDPVKFKHIDELMKLMSVLTHDERFVEVLNDEGGKPENMCEVLDRVEARGRAEGEARGKLEGAFEILVGLVKDGILTLAEAAKRAHMSPADFAKKAGLAEAKN